MKKILGIIITVVVAIVVILLINGGKVEAPVENGDVVMPTPNDSDIPRVSVIAEGLEIPWDILFLPDGDMLVSERPGRITKISLDGERTDIPYEGAKTGGEGGLLGMTLHPEFTNNRFIYIYLTALGEGGLTVNRVERYKLENNTLSDHKLIVGNIPGALYHDGGRIEFGPDGMLYVATGDATRENWAQDIDSLAGKILRVRDDGTIPTDNPFDSAVYSYGHRNPQGLAWDSAGRLWETEHGRSGVLSGLDEINLIEAGKNYGWPEIEGNETRSGMVTPERHSGSSDTWAPASLVYLNGKLYFGGLKGEALYEATLAGRAVTELREYFKGEFGRIRTVRIGPDGMLYLTTSNRDGRGRVTAGDDKIIRVNPSKL
jgi:glucose/arabinose dehydrogenase